MTNDNGQMTNVLIIFSHGLGDAVQLTSVLLQLRHARPEWVIDVAAGIGKHSAFHGLCRRVFILDREHVDRSAYAHAFELAWHECHKSYPNHPSTKGEQCLLDVFGLAPVPSLCRYEIQVRPAVRAAAERYLESLCPMGRTDDGRWPVVVIHYQGNSSADEKNLPHELIQSVCEVICAAEAVPIILDWDRRTPLADGVRIHNPGVDHPLWGATGTGDAEMVAALIAASTLVLAVDSGPMHIAGATRTPTIAVWTRHHPLHYFGHAPNVFHLVPEGHRAMLRGDRAVGAEYFAKHYDHATYSDLSAVLPRLVRERLPRPPEGLAFNRGFWIRRDNARQDLVVVQDVAEHDCYRMAEMLLPGPTLVDVGAHIGTASATFHKRYPSARIIALECCAENMPVLRRNVGRFATVVQAALSYEPDVALLNAVYPDCHSTGGSVVITKRDLAERLAVASVGNAVPGVQQSAELGTRSAEPLGSEPLTNHDSPITTNDPDPQSEIQNPQSNSPRLGEYWVDTRPMRTVTLEGLMAEHGLDWIDVLKLDCEGCELDLLDRCQVLDRVGLIVGEFHGRDRFLALVAERLPDWKFEILRDGDPGTFWLANPAPRRSQESGDRSQEQGITASAAQSDVDHPETALLRVHGRQVEFTAHHALRFTTDLDGSLIPALYFRGREITQPWSLELAGSGTRTNSDANMAVPERARDAAGWPAMRHNPQPVPARRDNRQSFCRHLGAESGLRECTSCRGNVHVKTFACAHPAHGETTLADCGTCADYEAREPVAGEVVRG
ncbi:MAG TPA: FkbM family methyltransferase [Pirellulales bacterium]|nr:FkbM family methyltransferase [Pirellulales bacterium]